MNVLVHGLVIHLLEETPRREVRKTYTQGVAMRRLAHVADDQVLHVRALGLLDAEDPEAADDVGVHAGARVVLAELVHEEDVDFGDG